MSFGDTLSFIIYVWVIISVIAFILILLCGENSSRNSDENTGIGCFVVIAIIVAIFFFHNHYTLFLILLVTIAILCTIYIIAELSSYIGGKNTNSHEDDISKQHNNESEIRKKIRERDENLLKEYKEYYNPNTWLCNCQTIHPEYESSCVFCGTHKEDCLPSFYATKNWICRTCGRKHPANETNCICGMNKNDFLEGNWMCHYCGFINKGTGFSYRAVCDGCGERWLSSVED